MLCADIFHAKGKFCIGCITAERRRYFTHRGLDMCNTCCSSNFGGRNSNCGCVNLLCEFANALNNFFTDPCNRGCGCKCKCNGTRNAWRNGFIDGWDSAREHCGCGCNGGNNRSGCGCGCNGGNNRGGCGCGCHHTHDLSALTDCGNYDAYYARQYGLTRNGCCCSL